MPIPQSKQRQRSVVTTNAENYEAKPFEIILCDAFLNDVNINLKPVAISNGVSVFVKSLDQTFNITVTADGAELIDFTNSIDIDSIGDTEELFCDGTIWRRL